MTELCPENSVTNTTLNHPRYWPVSATATTLQRVWLHWNSLLLLGRLHSFFHVCTHPRYILFSHTAFSWEAPFVSTGWAVLWPQFTCRSYCYPSSGFPGWWWKLILLGKVGNILKQFKIKIILQQMHRFDHTYTWHIFLSGQKKKVYPQLNQRTELRNPRNQLHHPMWPVFKRWLKERNKKASSGLNVVCLLWASSHNRVIMMIQIYLIQMHEMIKNNTDQLSVIQK